VLGTFNPVVPPAFADTPYLFLANDSPARQRKVLAQMNRPKFTVCDTMNHWIETERDELLELLKDVDGVVMNDQEALLLTQDRKLIAAGRKILEMGPKFVIVKKGEHGAMFFSRDGVFSLPAYPTADLVDPTGAGDSFAGGLMGWLASTGGSDLNDVKRAVAYGAVTASFTVEDFSLGRLRAITRENIDARYREYRAMLAVA
ncbi:MAG: PfkB family carbohydrate kinase, partial [Planctomycetia bacterium]